MQARASLPCHHPKWPMQCPHCNSSADGFDVTVPLSKHWNEKDQRYGRYAWKVIGMACMSCRIAVLPNKDHKDVSLDYMRVLVETDIPGGLVVQFVPEPWFDEHCRVPAEEPKNAEVPAK